jgi:hypothetical protein
MGDLPAKKVIFWTKPCLSDIDAGKNPQCYNENLDQRISAINCVMVKL